MKAAVIDSYEEPPAPAEFPDPVATDGQLSVEVELAAVNPVDLLIASGKFYAAQPPLPSVVGREGIARLADGGLAYFDSPVPPYGSIAEQTLLPADSLHHLPAGLEPGRALACGIAGLAAYLSLKVRARTAEGERVLILGAGGAVGQVGVVVARKLGASRVVAAARNPESLNVDADALVSVTGSRDEVADRIREAFGGEGPDVVLDPVWGVPAEAATEAMAFGGRLVQLGRAAGDTATFDSASVRGKCLQILGHTNFAHSAEEKGLALQEMFSWAATGDLDVPFEVLPLDRVGEAWERQAAAPGLKLTIDPRG
jgi:NADPH2:quinone reductase